jgi:hypothetical protein
LPAALLDPPRHVVDLHGESLVVDLIGPWIRSCARPVVQFDDHFIAS